MREISIEGKYIGNAIGYCHCEVHKGALNRELAYKHKCVGKKCKYLEKYNEESWKGVKAIIITKEQDKMEKEIDEEYINGNHASYYGGKDNPYEAIKVIEAWSEKNRWDGKQGFTYGMVLKYLSRAGQKEGNSEAQDIQKCINYLQMRLNNLK